MTSAAYGFRISGGPDDGWLSADGAEHWPELILERDAAVPRHAEARVDAGRFHAAIASTLADDQVLHPLLGRMLVFLAQPRGVDALHGGALLGRAGAWAVIGPKEAGKSTLLARCAQAGVAVLSDDVVVLDGTRCLAGPRCIDLRQRAAARLGPGIPVRGAQRSRIKLPPAPAETQLAGVVHLAWGERCEIATLRPSERLARLAEARTRERWPRNASLLLDLAVLPALELRRPMSLEVLDRSARLLTDAIDAS